MTCSMRIAAALHKEVAVFPLGDTSAASEQSGEGLPLGASTSGQDSITALQWVMWSPQQPLGRKDQCAGCKPSPSRDTATSDHNTCCLIVGTAAGYVQLHDINGLVLLRQRLHTGGPVQRVQVQPRAMGGWWGGSFQKCAFVSPFYLGINGLGWVHGSMPRT
eukprot:378589-Pelagomonas_calceolata.AAC.1